MKAATAKRFTVLISPTFETLPPSFLLLKTFPSNNPFLIGRLKDEKELCFCVVVTEKKAEDFHIFSQRYLKISVRGRGGLVDFNPLVKPK